LYCRILIICTFLLLSKFYPYSYHVSVLLMQFQDLVPSHNLEHTVARISDYDVRYVEVNSRKLLIRITLQYMKLRKHCFVLNLCHY